MLTTLLYIVFVLAALILIVVILLQEGKGGGFGQALGDGGQQTFGVGSKGINTFTGYTAAIFLISALVLHRMSDSSQTRSAVHNVITAESALPEGVPAAPADFSVPPPAGVPDGE